MVDPNVAGSKNGNSITVGHCPPPIMARGAPHHGVPRGLAVVNMKTVNDDIGDELDGNASPISNVDIGATGIDCLEAVHDQFLLQSDHHVPLEHNPQRPVLNHGVAEGAGSGVDRVVVAGIRNDVVSPIAAADCVSPEPNAAVCKVLTAQLPTGVAAPTIINWVPCSTREESQIPPLCAVSNAPEKIPTLRRLGVNFGFSHSMIMWDTDHTENWFSF